MPNKTQTQTPVMQESDQGGGEEGLPRNETLSGACKRLSKLPRPSRPFVNRKEGLNKIKNYLRRENDCRCVFVHGAVGMGKTATAVKAANEIRDNDDKTAVVYINYKYVRSVDDLALKIAKQVYHFPLNEPISEVKRRLTNEQDLFTVLLLDNFEHLLHLSTENGQANIQSERKIDPNEGSKIMKFIKEIVTDSANVKLLVTSSENVSFPGTGQEWIRLLPLQENDSFQLLKNVYGNRSEVRKEIAYKIAAFCSGIPHALTILASQQDHPPDLVRMMTNANPRQQYEKFTRIASADEDKKIDVCLDACFNRLEPQLQDTLISLTLFRGPFTMQTAEKVFQTGGLAGEVLELAQRSFLEQNILDSICWYSLLTVQKLYCQNKALEGHFHQVLCGARNLFIEHFFAFLEETFEKFLSNGILPAILAFRQQEENVMQLLDWFGSGAMDEDQMQRCIDVFNKVGELLAKMMGKKRFETVFTLLEGKSRGMGDQKRLSECLTSLGIREVFNCFVSPCLPDDAAEKAKNYLVEADGIQTTLEINTGNSRAQCLAKRGRCLAKEGKFREAKEKIEKAIEIRKEHGKEDSVMLGATYNDLAVVLSLEAAHQQEGAHERLREAINIRKNKTLSIYKRELGVRHPFTATILNSLSNNYYALHDLDNAKRYAEKALKIRLEMLKEHIDTAKSLFDLAMVHKEKGEFKETKAYLEQCEAMQMKVLDDNMKDLERTKQELQDVSNR